MGMRSSDATFLRRNIRPILVAASHISPEALEAVNALDERLDQGDGNYGKPYPPIFRFYDVHPTVRLSKLTVDDCYVPYIEASRGTAPDWPEDLICLTLDERFGLDTNEEECSRWVPFLANAMAVAAGRTSHGQHSYLRNPHGRSGGGDPPEIYGTPADIPLPAVDEAKLRMTTDASVWAEAFMQTFGPRLGDIDEGTMIGWFANAIEVARALQPGPGLMSEVNPIVPTLVCTKPGECAHCHPRCEIDAPHTNACMVLIQRPPAH